MTATIEYFHMVENFGDLKMGDYFIWGGDVYQKVEQNQTVRPRDGRVEPFFDEERVQPVHVTLQVVKRGN